MIRINGTVLGLAFAALQLGLGCSSSASENGSDSAATAPKGCTTDADCAADQGCYTKAASDAYCTKLCTEQTECPNQFSCPSLAVLAEPDCRDLPNHQGGKGVCQMFDLSLGPNACKALSPSDPNAH